MSHVTRVLSALEQGDPLAAEQLLPMVYAELRKLAAQKLALEKPGQTLQATALVHEAYVRLIGTEKAQHWSGRNHFFAAAAEAMRRILVENYRRKKTSKHGGDKDRVPLEEIDIVAATPSSDLLALDEALSRLAAEKPAVADLVKLRFFAGFTMDEAAQTLGISPATAYRQWDYARAWLFRELSEEPWKPIGP